MNNESKKYTFSLLGGDRRQTIVAEKLIRLGHKVKLYGLGEHSIHVSGAEICSHAEKAILGSDVIILPLPVSRDKVHLSFSSGVSVTPLKLNDIIDIAKKGGCSTILGGMIPGETARIAELNEIFIYDYYKSEELQRKNALPSAEGALMIAMEHTEKIIKGMNVIVSGYGKTGSCLVSLLDRLGAEVTVAARSDAALCEAALNGFKTVRIGEDTSELARSLTECDVIFNTVPAVIFGEQVLKRLKNKPLYIEIASNPGGIDLSAARDIGIQVIFAPSIPGKYAPVTAGEYIFETITDILTKRGIDI